MTIRDLLRAQRPTLSYELFPPRGPAGEAALPATMDLLAATEPDFMSITYGASGSTQGTSRGVVQRLAEAHAVPPLAHLTCVDQSRADLIEVIEGYLAEGVSDFLALRGDPPKGQSDWRPHPDGLLYAYELVALDAAQDDAQALAAGVAHAARLSTDLLDASAPGIHIITFNKHEAALALVDALGLRTV